MHPLAWAVLGVTFAVALWRLCVLAMLQHEQDLSVLQHKKRHRELLDSEVRAEVESLRRYINDIRAPKHSHI